MSQTSPLSAPDKFGLLPKSKTQVVKDPRQVKFYTYGAPGVGKTTLASRFRKQKEDGTWIEPIFLCTEEGVGFLEVYKVPIPSWGTFKETLKQIVEADPEAQTYGTIVVDTIDLLFTMCEKFVCELKQITHPSELEWGKGWAALRDEFQVVLSYLSRMKQGLVLVGHAKIWEKKERGIVTTCIQPTLNNTGRRVVLPIVDVILYIEAIEVQGVDGKFYNKRIMRSEPTDMIEAKDRTGMLPAVMPLDYAALEAYISGTIHKTVPWPPPVPAQVQDKNGTPV